MDLRTAACTTSESHAKWFDFAFRRHIRRKNLKELAQTVQIRHFSGRSCGNTMLSLVLRIDLWHKTYNFFRKLVLQQRRTQQRLSISQQRKVPTEKGIRYVRICLRVEITYRATKFKRCAGMWLKTVQRYSRIRLYGYYCAIRTVCGNLWDIILSCRACNCIGFVRQSAIISPVGTCMIWTSPRSTSSRIEPISI